MRLAALVSGGMRAERALVLSRSRTARAQLRERSEVLLDRPHEELWIHTYEEAAESLLRDYSVEAGLDPFFTTVGGPDRLAILLDHLDELPLRRHEIRGNPAGLLARLLRRIDVLKAEAVMPAALRDWAVARERSASTAGERESAEREIEFADLYARHDRILREAGSLDGGDLVLELGKLLRDRADVAEAIGERFTELLVDELEDAGIAHRRMLDALAAQAEIVCACDPEQAIRRFRGAGQAALAAFRAAVPPPVEVDLGGSLREPETTRFWRCENDRAQAQAVAREVEHLLSSGEVRPEAICVIAGAGWREGRLVAAALEERSVPYRFAGDAAFYQRPEVRDALAWLRMLADPSDAAAVVRALTQPPIELRSVDLAKVTTIARRRKLDMVSALDAAVESPQLPPEARDRIQSFLRLHRAASNALEQMRADVFVRRLIERVGLRRHRLFAASPETAERLVNLSRLAELAAEWSRREPRGSVRDFVRHLNAVAEAGELGGNDCDRPVPGAVLVAEPEQVKGLEFEHVYLLGLRSGAIAAREWEDGWIAEELLGERLPQPSDDLIVARRMMLAHVATSRAARALVLSWPQRPGQGGSAPSRIYRAARERLEAEEEFHEEELFGPAEGLHSTYRMQRDEVLEASWRAGSALSEMRLDTAADVDAAVARYLELIKLAALIQRPESEAAPEAIAAINELLGQVASTEQRIELDASSLDQYLIGEESERKTRREQIAARREPSLEQFLPRRKGGLGLSASDIDLYRTCPLKYKFARVFAIPQEPTINQRFGILIHQVLERFHAEELRAAAGGSEPFAAAPGSIERLLALFEAGWRRQGFGSSDDELQYRDRAVAALARYEEHHLRSRSEPVWLERSFSFAIGPHQLRGRVDRVDRLPDGGYELIDYKTGDPGSGPKLAGDVQIALYRLGAREAWEIEATTGSYWYVLADQRVEVPAEPDDAERVERTVLEVAAGITDQDFEPRPSHEICSWCDYRLICPASEA
jgi:DNA helicase-2/ATP-dependent DNA helicase PcrA